MRMQIPAAPDVMPLLRKLCTDAVAAGVVVMKGPVGAAGVVAIISARQINRIIII